MTPFFLYIIFGVSFVLVGVAFIFVYRTAFLRGRLYQAKRSDKIDRLEALIAVLETVELSEQSRETIRSAMTEYRKPHLH